VSIGSEFESIGLLVRGERRFDVGRNWSKQKVRDAAQRHRQAATDMAHYLVELEAPSAQPSKAELREEAAAAIARYTGPVRRLPTMVDLKCYRCNHRGRVRVYPGERKRFKCSKCGAVSL
jgi:hypothetical protein